jgi:hypothetical protein
MIPAARACSSSCRDESVDPLSTATSIAGRGFNAARARNWRGNHSSALCTTITAATMRGSIVSIGSGSGSSSIQAQRLSVVA